MINVEHLIPLLSQYGYWLIFPIAVIEGPIISIVVGFLLSLGYFDFKVAYLVLIAGDLIGDSIYYFLGRWGSSFTKRILRLDEKKIENFSNFLKGNLNKTFVFGKFAHGLGSITWFGMGTLKVPFRKFLVMNTLTTAVKSLLLLTLGFYFGKAYLQVNKRLDELSIVLIVLFVLVYILLAYTGLPKKIFRRK